MSSSSLFRAAGLASEGFKRVATARGSERSGNRETT
jgi:hypothetical protein